MQVWVYGHPCGWAVDGYFIIIPTQCGIAGARRRGLMSPITDVTSAMSFGHSLPAISAVRPPALDAEERFERRIVEVGPMFGPMLHVSWCSGGNGSNSVVLRRRGMAEKSNTVPSAANPSPKVAHPLCTVLVCACQIKTLSGK